VDRLVAKNYGCLKDVDVRLTPLHCFIGPNDSGKSTILRAVETLSLFLSKPAAQIVAKQDSSTDKLMGQIDSRSFFLGAWSGDYCLVVQPHQQKRFAAIIGEGEFGQLSNQIDLSLNPPPVFPHKKTPQVICIFKVLLGARTIRLDPDALQRASVLIRGTNIDFYDERGLGLPAVYDALASQDAEEYVRLIKQIKKLFPSINKIQLIGTSESTKVINVELVTGERIEPQHLSTGLLYYLAYAAIPYLHPCAVLLIEEPENGLHPARIAEVMGILREVSKTTQVLIATHSPLVVNELQPDEVSIVTREPEQGTKVTPLMDTPNFEERAKVYALGELWVSYANGDDEGPLLNPPPAEQD